MNFCNSYRLTTFYYRTLAKEGPLGNIGPPPTLQFGLNLLLRSNIYLNMRPCVAALENAAQMTGYED